MKRVLTKGNGCYYFSSGEKAWGANPRLYGDCSGLSGDCSRIYGDCSRLSGDLDDAEISDEDRKMGASIDDIVIVEAKLFGDLTTDEEKYNFFLSGRAYSTG